MAATEQVTEWDAQGSPISSGQSAPTEWDAQGNPIHASAAPSLSDNPNGEGVYQMKAPTGQTVGVPYSKVVDARNQGHSFADDNEQGRFNKDYSFDPANQGKPGLSAAPSYGHRIVSAIAHPLNSMEAAAQPVSRPHGASIPEMVNADLNNVAAGATGVVRHPIRTVAGVVAPVVKYGTPVVAAYDLATGQPTPNIVKAASDTAKEMGQQANENGPQFAATMLGQGLAMGAGGEALSAAVPKLPGVKGWVEQNTPVPGTNYTPVQHSALSGVLARGTGMGKDFFPRDVAETIASPVRQVVADNPELAKAIHQGTPEDSIGAFQKALDLSKEKIDVAHQQALGPVRDTPFDMAPVQKAVTFPKSLEGFAPEDAEAIADLRTRLGNVKTLDGANELRMWLNRELAPEFRKNAAAGGRSGAVDSAMSSALSALRDPYYEALEKASGQDFSGLKRTEGGIIKAQEAMGNVAPELAKKQALATEPKSPRQALADALKGGRTIHGGPVTGTANLIAEKVLKSTPLGDVQAGLQRVFSKLPEKSAPPPPPNRPLQLPAPQGGTPFTIENSGHGAEPFPGSMAGVPSPEPVPATVTPAPAPTLQLPAVASPEGTTEPPQSPGTPPPPVNEATARMRVQPLPENPEPVPPSPAGFTVGPDGVARREPAGALPAPAPKPKSAPKVKPAMSHPAGDVTGIDEKTGLPIVRRTIPAATEPDGGAAPAQAAAPPPEQPSLTFEQRPVIQASANPDELHASAQDQKPVMQEMAEKAVEGVPGAKVEGMRVKDAESVENKADRGKPPETIADHLGARVSAPTPEGVEQVKQNVESQLPVAQADKITNNGVDADQYAVQTGKPGEPNQQSELQVVTKPQAEAMKATDGLYGKQKEAEAKGDTAKAATLGERIAQHFEKAKGQATSDFSTSNEGAKPEVTPAFAKGDRVTLPDGRAGTVQFYDGKITRNARVKLDDGSMVTSVKGSELKPADAAQPGANETHPDAKGDKWIGVDLDGTMAQYDGFKGPGNIGEPITEMVDRVKQWLKDGNNVKILTARVNEDPGGVARAAIEDWTQKHLGQKLPITDVKDQHMVALYDDRAVPVERNTGRLLAQHQPEDAHAQPRISSGADANAKAEAGGNVPAQKEAAAGSTGNAGSSVTSGKDAVGSEGGKQGAEKSWAETVKAKKAAPGPKVEVTPDGVTKQEGVEQKPMPAGVQEVKPPAEVTQKGKNFEGRYLQEALKPVKDAWGKILEKQPEVGFTGPRTIGGRKEITAVLKSGEADAPRLTIRSNGGQYKITFEDYHTPAGGKSPVKVEQDHGNFGSLQSAKDAAESMLRTGNYYDPSKPLSYGSGWNKLEVKNYSPSRPPLRPDGYTADRVVVQVPGDGRFTIPNHPGAIEGAMDKANRFEFKPGAEPRVSNPRAPKEFDYNKHIQNLTRQIDEHETDARKAMRDPSLIGQAEYHNSQLFSLRKELQEAKSAQAAEAHGLMTGEHALGGPALDSAAEKLDVYFEGQEREHGANALKAIHKSVEEAVDETDAGAGKQPVQRMEKGRTEGTQGSNAAERDE